ncbi:MAG: tail tape measure [Chaetfec virus UA24_144]|nr:MAG: tail tape measure [Chaetfec virus UA24_144]
MSTVDSRVVEMKFDNKNFESNVSKSMSTLDKLKQKLQFKDASKSLKDLENSTKNFNMSPMEKAANVVSERFSAMGIMATTVLQNLTTSAMNAGTQIVKALTLDPVMAGFQEYETQINAVQTILANTSHNNTTLDQVNSALDELNLYADKTIYNFTEMTRNIGTFTAAGVDLDTSVSAIKGISNLAAVSGSTSQQASTAMYQLSQALAAGKVNLMDWNSVVNAGMGGKVFQDSLMETARVHGISIDQMIKDRGSFRETLQEGWLSSEILLETLSKFTGDLSKEQLIQMGYTEEQTEAILKMGQTANDAATKVKTWTQLVDTLGEALQSGWTQSWEIILGDFEEAKVLFTEVSDTLGEMINDSANARNAMLQSWKDLGGRTAVIDGIRNAFQGIVSIVKAIGDAFSEIFPPLTGEKLADISFKFRDLTERMKPSAETLDKIKRVAKGVFSAIDILRQGLSAVMAPIGNFLGGSGVGGIGSALFDAAASLGDWVTNLNQSVKESSFFVAISSRMSSVLEMVSNGISIVVGKARELISNFGGIGDVFERFKNIASNAMNKVKEVFVDVVDWIKENFNLDDIFNGAKVAGGFGILVVLRNIGKKIKETLEPIIEAFGDGGGGLMSLITGKGGGGKDSGPGLAETFKEVLGSVNETLQSFTSGIKVASIVGIAAAVMILSSALRRIGALDTGRLVISLAAIAGMLDLLDSALTNMADSVKGVKGAQLMAAATTLIGLAAAIRIIASAMAKLGQLDTRDLLKGLGSVVVLLQGLRNFLEWTDFKDFKFSSAAGLVLLAASLKIMGSAIRSIGELPTEVIVKGLVGVAGALVALSRGVELLDNAKVSFGAMASLIFLATSLRLIVTPMKQIGEMNWNQIAKGLTGMTVALGTLVGSTVILSKFTDKSALSGAAAVLILSLTLRKVVDALDRLKDFKTTELIKSLSGMAVALAELSAVLVVLNKFSNAKSNLAAAASVLILAHSLEPIGNALQQLSTIPWTSLAKSVLGVAGALAALSGTLVVLNKFSGAKKNLGNAAAMLILVQTLKPIGDALQQIGSMRWQDVAKGVAGMTGALGALSGALVIISKFSKGGRSLLASGALLTAVLALKPVADALQQVGSMRWQDVAKGVGGLVSTLGALAAITTISGNLGGFMSLFGSASLLLAVQSLGPVAEALNALRGMSWDEIGAATTGIVGVLVTLSAVTGISGTLTGVMGILGSGALLVGAQALGPLADALREIGDIDGESLDRAIGGMMSALAVLAGGGFINTLSIIGDLAILVAVQSLSKLADGLREFSSLSWDEIERGTEGMKRAFDATAWGGFVNTFGLIGGLNINIIVQPLHDLASALQEFGSMSWGEINRGITAMSEALGATGLGGFVNTFSGFGAGAIATMAEPLGVLADSVRKWEGVNVPSDLGESLGNLADGIGKFTFSGWGAGGIAESAAPLGVLADSVRKWEDVHVPEDLGENLKVLGQGVSNFGPQFLNGLGETAGPLGVMADSVKKWENVTVPEDLGDNLKKLGEGVRQFGGEFFVGGNMGSIAGPLGDMADSVQRWKDVTVPGDLKDNLDSLAKGVGSFGMEFFTGGNIGNIVGPLGDLSDAVRRWEGVTFPTGYSLELELYGLKNGLSALSEVNSDFIGNLVGPIGDMAGSIASWSTVTFPEGFSLELELYGLKNGLSSVSELSAEKLESLTGPISAMAGSIGSWATVVIPEGIEARLQEFVRALKELETINDISIDFSGITNGVSGLLSALSSYSGQFSSVGQSMVSSLNLGLNGTAVSTTLVAQMSSLLASLRGFQGNFGSTGTQLVLTFVTNMRNAFSSQQSSVVNRMESLVLSMGNTGLNTVRSFTNQFYSAGRNLMDQLANGVRSGASGVSSAIRTVLSNASNVGSYYWNFYRVGSDMMSGLANGISGNSSRAINAAANAASQALAAAKRALDSHSPSKKFMKLGEDSDRGLAIGFRNASGLVSKASREVAESSLDGMRDTVSKVAQFAESDIDTQPKIRPVLDTTELRNGLSGMDGLLYGRTISVETDQKLIPRRVESPHSMTMKRQEEINESNREVLSAIDRLTEQLSAPTDQTWSPEINLYVDKKKLASSLAEPMNRQLQILSKRGGLA